MRFGFISHVVGARESAAIIRETIELAVYAEELGFDSFWVAQHHFGSQRGHCPAPLVLLAAIAARTNRIQLGTAVVVGSLEDPIRLAEDAAMVDVVSGGRLQLGLGAGADERTAERFGRAHADRHSRFTENLRELIELLTPGSELVPSVPGLRDRLWLGTASDSGFALAADCGVGILTGRTSGPDGPRDDIAARRVATYRDAVTARGCEPRVAVSRSVLCAESTAVAFTAMRPGITDWLSNSAAPGRFPGNFDAAQYVRTGHVYLGSGLEVANQVQRDAVAPAATDFLCNVQPAAPDISAIRTSLRLFARDVIHTR